MRRIPKITWHGAMLLILAIGALLPVGCTRKSSGQPVVTVSIPPLAYFAEQIGGDKISIRTLVPAGTDPETFEPSMAQMRQLADSKLLFTSGLLPFEERLAKSASTGSQTVALSDSIHLITGTHGDGEADPHIWTSLRNARIIARQVAAALSEAYPEFASEFATNLAALNRQLEKEDKEIEAQLLPFRGRSFLVWHPSLSYFARDYGLNQIVLGEEHKEVSVNQLRDKINQVKSDSAMVFFFQKEFDSRQAHIVTDATGLVPVEISPMSTDIITTVKSAAGSISSSKR